MKDIDKLITFLKEIDRIQSDIAKHKSYPDNGEPFDYNADELQILTLLELIEAHTKQMKEDSVFKYKLRKIYKKRIAELGDDDDDE